jgi:hypothetical protein
MTQETLIWINAIFMATNFLAWLTLRKGFGDLALRFHAFHEQVDKYTAHCEQTAVAMGSEIDKQLKILLSPETLNELRVYQNTLPSSGGRTNPPTV